MTGRSPFAYDTSSFLDEKSEKERWARETYAFQSPWEPSSSTVIRNHERDIQAGNYSLKPPWEQGEKEKSSIDKECVSPINKGGNRSPVPLPYKFVPLHAPIELSPAEIKRAKEYKSVPPFRTEDNYDLLKDVSLQRKIVKAEPQKSLAPWLHGKETYLRIPQRKMVSARSTSLWSVEPSPKNEETSSGDPVLDKLRRQLKVSGAAGILGLSKKFRIVDDDGSGMLSIEEFRKCLRESRLELTSVESSHLFRYFDRDDSGGISYSEFLIGARGELNKRRKAIVELAFAKLDKDGSSIVTVEDIAHVYNASGHPDVLSGRRSEEAVLVEFLDTFDVGGERDGCVTRDEFLSYYANVSASIDDDDYFELMIRNAWHISGGEGWCANTSNRRVLVTGSDGRESVQEAKEDNIYHQSR